MLSRLLAPSFACVCPIALAAGCVATGDDTRPSTLRTDSAGVEIVTTGARERPLAWRFEPVVRLGGVDAGPQSFFQVRQEGLAIGEDGNIYVLDAGNRHVQVFDRTGVHLRTIGRRGRGPGEFQFPWSIALRGSDTLLVLDVGQRTLLSFGGDGAYLGQVPAPRGVFGRIRTSADRVVYATRSANRDNGESLIAIRSARDRDTASHSVSSIPAAKSLVYESCRVSISLPPLYADPPAWDARGGRIAVAQPPHYAVRIIADGRAERLVRRPVEPQPATTEHALLDLGDGEEWVIGDRPCTVPGPEVVEKRGLAPSVPVIADLFVWPDGGVWVRRKVMGSKAGPIDVFDATGEYVGTLPGASPWPSAVAPGGEFLALESDELDVPRVTLYRLDSR